MIFDDLYFYGTCGARLVMDPSQIHKLRSDPLSPRSSLWVNHEPDEHQPKYVKAVGCEWLTGDAAPVLSLNDRQAYVRLSIFSSFVFHVMPATRRARIKITV